MDRREGGLQGFEQKWSSSVVELLEPKLGTSREHKTDRCIRVDLKRVERPDAHVGVRQHRRKFGAPQDYALCTAAYEILQYANDETE